MDIIIMGEDRLKAAEGIANGSGVKVSIPTLVDTPEDAVNQLREVQARAVIFSDIPDWAALDNAVQTAKLYRRQTGINIAAMYCVRDNITKIN